MYYGIELMIEMNAMKLRDMSEEAILAEALLAVPTVPCTGCRYCVDGCPMGIRIPDLIACLNNSKLYGMNHRAEVFYERFAEAGAPASACVRCGQCEGVCPQHLNVIEVLAEAAKAFEK